MRNRQTCTICHLHLILPAVALVEVQTIKIIRQVVRRTGVQDPVRRLMGGGCGRRVGGAVVMIIAAATVAGLMTPILAYLAPGTPAAVATTPVATSVSSSIAAIAAVVVVTTRGVALAVAIATRAGREGTGGGAAAARAARIGGSAGSVVVDRPRRDVGGGLPIPVLGLLLLKGLVVENAGVEHGERDWHAREVHGGGDGVERRAEPGQHVVDDLIIAKRRAGGGHRVSEGLDLLHILAGGTISLAQRLNLAPEVAHAGAVLGGEHGVHGRPGGGGRPAANELRRDLHAH